ncbi:MAG: hypothetical protein M3R13_08505 [Armatimonadota bacterium]|nr:hypothetical protein [Armatimonadota bacterium]
MSAKPFALLVALLAVFWVAWVANAYVRVPLGSLNVANVIVTIIFVALPIVIIAAAARLHWRPLAAIGVVMTCLAVVTFARGGGPGLDGIVQISRFGWPAALGFVISGLIKDRNLLLPIAMVLATVDLLAVFAPAGTVNQGLQSPTIRPIFDALAYQVPEAGTAQPLAQMGPADPLFIAMFLYAIRKFGMKFRRTLLWLIPALAAYLGIVLIFGSATIFGFSLGALPALVPVAFVVAIVNAREFRMSKQEIAMTVVVAAVCVGLVAAMLTVWRAEPGSPPVPTALQLGPTVPDTSLVS